MDGGQNPFDQMINAPAATPGTPPATDAANPFSFAGTIAPQQTSALGAGARAAAQNTLPALGGLPAAGAGAEIGAELGAGIGSVVPGAGTAIGAGLGGFAGGLGGFMLGSSAISQAQHWAVSKLPDSWQDKLGASDRQQQLDQSQHPDASFIGGLVPYALTMSPGGLGKAAAALPENATAFQRIMANPIASRLFSGGLMGGMELGQEKEQGQPVNWAHVAISTGFGMVFNHPNQFGETLSGMGAGMVPRSPLAPATPAAPGEPEAAPDFGPSWEFNPSVDHAAIAPGDSIVHTNTLDGKPEGAMVTAVNPYGPDYPGYSFRSSDGNDGFTPPDKVTGTLTPTGVPTPTLAQAADLKVMGPGITEAVFQGSHTQDPASEMTAQDGARTEQSLIGAPPPGPDVTATARRMSPELFDQYDALSAKADGFRQWLEESSYPPDDRMQEAEDRLNYAKGKMQDTQGSASFARWRAATADAQSQYDALTAQRQAFTSGTATDTAEMTQVRGHLQDIDAQMRDLAPQVSAAYRRAAEYADGESVETEIAPEINQGAQNTPEVPKSPPEIAEEAPKITGAAPESPESLFTEPPAPLAKPIEEQRADIAADVTKRLVAAGHSQEEAAAKAEIVASHYVSRAARIPALGTPEEVYRREGAIYKGERQPKGKRGGGAGGGGGPRGGGGPPKTPAEAWADITHETPEPVSERTFAEPGEIVHTAAHGELVAVNEVAGDTQVLAAKPDEAGQSEVFIHDPETGEMDSIGKADFGHIADTMHGEALEPIAEPLPEAPAEVDAEAIKRSAAPEISPEAQVEKDIEATAPPVVVPEPEKVTAEKDAYADKWFGTKDKAEAFIAKKGLGATHEVVGTGKRWEIKPKAEGDKAEEPAPLHPGLIIKSLQTGKITHLHIGDETARPKPEVTVDRKGREWQPIGENSAGDPLYEDQHGVRSTVSEGIRSIEPVAIQPQGGISVNRDIHTEFKVAEAPPEEPASIAGPEDATVKAAEGEPKAEGLTNDNVEQQSGEAVRRGTPEVPARSKPEIPPETAKIRYPSESSPFGGGERGAEARDNHDETPAQQGGAEPPVARPAGVVTAPPRSDAGDNSARPDTAAGRGISEARTSIEERSRSNYRITDADEIGAGGPRAKIKANIDAIRILKAMEEEERNATPEEKAALVKYTGWGTFAQDMFAARNDTYKAERDAFRSLVTDEEYAAAKASTLNAHYTSPDVVKGMWDSLLHMGYDGGLAIEPSAGVGHFIGLIPDEVAPRTAWTGVELDPLTGRIAKALYGGAEINIQGFETLRRPSNYYDLAVSNVPFGNYNLKEKAYGAYPIHDFFFVKSLDKVRPGGVVAFITSRFTMDKLDTAMRRELAKSADLVGAIRLPGGNKGAFAGNAGTAVTTDIIYLRKKIPGEAPFPGANWLVTKEVQTPEGPATINQYFADHPEMMLGEMRLTRGMYSDKEPTLVGDAEGLREKIGAAAQKMPEGAFTQRQAPAPATVSAYDIEGNVKDGAFFLKDGKVYQKELGAGTEAKLSKPDIDRVSRLVGMRDIVNDLLKTQLSGAYNAAEQAEHLREKLRTAYDAFVAKHGPINKEVRTVTSRLNKQGEPIVTVRYPNFSEFKSDPDAFKVAAIEKYDAESGEAKRATIQEKDVISKPTERQIESPADAVAAVLNDKGRIDLQAIGQMLGAKSEDEVVNRLGDMIYQNPDGRQWQTADDYLSGDVVSKLEEAREIAKSDPAYQRNVAALEKVQPEPLAPNDITPQFGAPWIPAEVYEKFLEEIGARDVAVRKVPGTADWKIQARTWSRDAVSKYGADRTDVRDIVNAAINNRQITVYDNHEDGSRTVNQPATEQARIKIDALKEVFAGDPDAGIDSWVWQDPDRAESLAAIYNRTFNNIVPRKFDGTHQTFPGMSAELTLRPHQSDAVWRTVQSGNTLFAHVVGAGKTFTMITSGMEQRRLGLIKKPMYVVPNHMLEQFSREFLQAYPDAKILVAQKDEMGKDDRRALIGKIAANDWDGVVITHGGFGRINVAAEFRQQFVRDQIEALEKVRRDEAAESGAKSPTVKELEKAKKKLETKLESLLNETNKDEGTGFEESGCDFLYVDEAHLFKNLSFPTRLQRVKGLSQGDSQRAEDLFMKMRYLEQKRPGRSGVFATGTPVSNTMAELWTMMRYLELDKLKERGLDNFDAWASTFGKVVNNMELSADGRTFKEVSSFSKFVNVPELISLYSEIADTRTADMLNLPRPEVKTREGKPGIEIVNAEPSEQEEAHINHLVQLAESLKGQRPEPGKPNMLSVVTGGRKVATDGRLIDPEAFEFNPQGKIAHAVTNIARIYHEGKEPGMAQMVFLDLGVPSPGATTKRPATMDTEGNDEAGNPDPGQSEVPRINLYADLKERLVKEGIPANQIAFIHDAGDDDKKAKLFAKVRSGEVRVLVGSSQKMGVGTNVQDKLIAMHHLDAPWRPADVEQRDGRIVRQGNQNPAVQIYRYVTKRSFDAFMWQKLDTKSKFIGQVLSGAKGSRHAEDVDNPLPEAAEMKAAASGDPRIMEHAEISRQVRQLAAQKRAFDSTQSRATWELKSAKARIAEADATAAPAKADAARVTDISGDKFKVKLGGKDYDSRKEAGELIVAKLAQMGPTAFYTPRDIKVGEMSGFDMHLELQTKWGSDEAYIAARASLAGDGKYSSIAPFTFNAETDPVGLMRKFETILPRIADRPAAIEAMTAGERQNVEKLSSTLAATWPRAQEYADTQKKLADLTNAMRPKAPEQEKPPEITAQQPEQEFAQGKEDEDGRELHQAVYHGSRSTFDRFVDEHIGTGAGNQNYGHGLYFSSKREVAEFYKGESGKLYHVDIPEDDQFLDWSKTYAQQPEPVKAALAKLGHNEADMRTGEQIYDDLHDNPVEASATLRNSGIAGIKYPSGGSSRYARDSAPNYVLFDANAAKIMEFEQGIRGKIQLANGKRPIITMMKDANASTFFHETGHQWLEELLRDAAHPEAPEGLKTDAQTVHDWLGTKPGLTIPTRAHEKWAKGFEQYIREGVAPSARLAGVFAKFKTWLTSIYQTIKGLGAPISDDIRGVMDRLIEAEPQRTVVAPERAPQPSIADVHDADAEETEPHEAEAARDRIVNETKDYISRQPPEIVHEVTEAIAAQQPRQPGAEPGAATEPAGETGAGPNGEPEMGAGGGGAEPVPGRGASGENRQPELRGGGKAQRQGPGVSGHPAENAAGSAGSQSGRNAGPLAPGPAEQLSGPDSDLVDKAGNIRLDNINSDEDIKQVLRDIAAENNGFIGDRRGRVTDGQLLDGAQLILGRTPDFFLAKKIGQAFNAEEATAIQILAAQSAKAVSAAMKKAADGTDADVVAYAEAKARHQLIQAKYSQATAESGRATRALRKLKDIWTPEAEATRDFLQSTKDATGKTLYQLREEAKLGAELDSPEQVSKFMVDGMKRSFGRMILEYWINGLISGPATHTTYMIGNTMLGVLKAGPETGAAAAIGKLRERFGRPGDTVRPGEMGAQFAGAKRGFAPALHAAAEALQSGVSVKLPTELQSPDMPFQPDVIAKAEGVKFDATMRDAAGAVFSVLRGMRDGVVANGALIKAGGVKGEPFIGAKYSPLGQIPDITYRGATALPLGNIARVPSRFIAAIHSFFRVMNYSMATSGDAYHVAANEGLKGEALDARVADLRQNPTPEMMERNAETASELTLMSQGGAFMRHLSALTNFAPHIPGLGETPIFKFVDPFVHIAANVLDQSIVQRTPAGLLSAEIRADLMGKNGNLAADTAAAKMLVGTALSVLFGGLAGQGLVTGSGPTNPNQQAMWRLAGYQPHSVRIGNIWYQVNRLGPVGMLSGIAADIYGVGQQASTGDASGAAASLVHAFAQNILDESFMSGPAQLMQALEDSDRYGAAYVRNFLSSFIPFSVGMQQMARAADPYSRQARNVVDAIRAKIPGQSEFLLPRRDIWGQPIPNNPAVIASGVTAIYEQQISHDPVNIAMLALGIAPAPVDRKIRGITLNDQQYDDYARIAGRMTKMRLNTIVNSPDWRTWEPGYQANIIDEVIRQSRETAAGIVMMKYPTIPEAAARLKLAKFEGRGDFPPS